MLRPITAEGSLGQQGGFLRDNNPWNIGTGCSATGAYGGTPKAPYGPDPRCGGGPVYLNTFATPLEGAKATAQYLTNFGGFSPLVLNAPSSVVLKGTWYKGDAKAAAAVPVTAAAVATAARALGTSPSTLATGTTAPKDIPGTSTPADAAAIHQFWATLRSFGVQAPNLNATQEKLAYELFLHTYYDVPLPSTYGPTVRTLTRPEQLAVSNAVEAVARAQYLSSTSIANQLDPTRIPSEVAQGVKNTVGNPLGGLAAIGAFFSDISSGAFWKRIGVFALGGALVIGGGIIFLSTTKPVQMAEGLVP